MSKHKIPEGFSKEALELTMDIMVDSMEQTNVQSNQIVKWKDEEIAELKNRLQRAYAETDILRSRFDSLMRVSSAEIDKFLEMEKM